MSKIEDFLKVHCGDPAKGAFEAPASFEELVELFNDFMKGEVPPLTTELAFMAGEMAEGRTLFNHVNLRRLSKCEPMPMPSRDARIATGLSAGRMAHLLAYLERYMDAHPEEFGVIKIEKNG